MRNFLPRALLVFLLVSMVNSFKVKSKELDSCDLAELVSLESKTILQNENIDDMIKVYNFGAIVKLPSRYALMVNNKIGNSIVLNSSFSSQNKYQEKLNCTSNTSIVGNVEIANREKCELCSIEVLLNEKIEIISELKFEDVNYIEAKYQGSLKKWYEIGIIFDKDTYMLIADQNPKLKNYVFETIKRRGR